MSSNNPAKIEFVPWDHTSQEHVERMRQQRMNCGWMSEMADMWTKATAKGIKTMYWILLADDHPGRNEQLATHKARYPTEATPIKDTAATHWGSPREASQRAILPIGHIGVGYRSKQDAELGLASEGVVWLGPVYVSWALQRGGLGRATMQAAESMVAGPPFNAKLSALDAISEKSQFSPGMLNLYYLSQGNQPGMSNETWYRKQGYEEFHLDPEAFFFTDPETGEKTPIPTYFFKKSLGK